jgi:hypothetical protein
MTRILAHKPDLGNGVGLHYNGFCRFTALGAPQNQLLAPTRPRENRRCRPPIREVGLGDNSYDAMTGLAFAGACLIATATVPVHAQMAATYASPPGADMSTSRSARQNVVESECGAVAVDRTYLLPPLSSGGASLARPWLRFHTPLIEPDMQISRIRLSDKTSRLRPRLAAPTRGQAYETVMPVEMREWIRPAPASPDLVLEAQPPAQPHGCVVVERPIRFRD